MVLIQNKKMTSILNDASPAINYETILIDGDYYQALLADIRNANTSIDIESYIFNDDTTGNKIGDALVNASIRGVKIRVLVDGVGSLFWGGRVATKLEKAGIPTRVYHPFPWHWHRTHPFPGKLAKFIYLLSKINARNHRKITLIDKKIVYIGSANIADCHCNKEEGGDSWHDITVRITHVDTTNLAYAFNRAWGQLSLKERIQKPTRQADPIFRLNYGLRQRRLLYKFLLLRIAQCTKRIWVINSYFVPDNILLAKLVKAAKKGVDVKILLPHKSDVFVMSLVATTFYTQLLNSGATIFEYLPSILHAKVLILDDWYCVGSSNLNYRSLRHDLEVDVNIRTSEAQKTLEQQFLSDLKKARQIKLEDLRKQSLFKRLVGRLLLYIRHWL